MDSGGPMGSLDSNGFFREAERQERTRREGEKRLRIKGVLRDQLRGYTWVWERCGRGYRVTRKAVPALPIFDLVTQETHGPLGAATSCWKRPGSAQAFSSREGAVVDWVLNP